MLDLSEHFRPATAQPFMKTLHYSEISPCEALKPYIRCFWGTVLPGCQPIFSDERKSLVIPDGCMDIIFRGDLAKSSIDAYFCGLDENGWQSASEQFSGGFTFTFGVRFYLWAAGAFVSDTLSGSAGQGIAAEALFPGFVREMSEFLRRGLTLHENAKFAEVILLRGILRQPDDDIMNSLEFMLSRQGRVTLAELMLHTGCTAKRLQRLFGGNIGASPKSVMSVIRYQLMWQEMLRTGSFSALDAVERYGYYDQAHLLHDFKRRHLMTPQAALELAKSGSSPNERCEVLNGKT